MVWKILGKEFGVGAMVFILKSNILPFYFDDLKVLNDGLDKDGCGESENAMDTKRKRLRNC